MARRPFLLTALAGIAPVAVHAQQAGKVSASVAINEDGNALVVYESDSGIFGHASP